MDFAHAYEGLWRSYMQGISLGDPDWLAALFAEDGVILGPGGDPVIGRAAIRAYQFQHLQAYEFELEMHTAETEDLGRRGWGYGTFAMVLRPRDGSAPTKVTGKYLNIVQPREDGTLEIVRHCWNADQGVPQL